MKGHIRQRGKNSFELKFDAGRDPATGGRKIQYRSFKGTKREAQAKLTELLASVGKGSYVETSRDTVADYVRARINLWEEKGKVLDSKDGITARTAQRYRQLCENQIAPHLGNKLIQRLTTEDIEAWHSALRKGGRVRTNGGLAARTITHAHRLLGKALSDAARHSKVAMNVCREEAAPKVDDAEMIIVQDVPALLAKLGADRLQVIARLALFTGMRRGEILALRWANADLDAKVARVREALEITKEHGVRFKAPKSKAGRRDISLPDAAVDALRDYRKAVLEQRMQLGAGKLPDSALVFSDIDGGPLSPDAVSAAWSDYAKKIGMGGIKFHALRHTHASQLIDANVDIVTISKRLGHAKPDITLRIYAHLFRKDDSKAAAAINAALGVS
jgi:integrase